MEWDMKVWNTFRSAYPELVQYFAYDFPVSGTRREYVQWVENVRNGIRGDPDSPRWDVFFPAPIPVKYKDLDAQEALSRLYDMYRQVVNRNPSDFVSDSRRFDMYVLPDSYVFVLPHTPYGWGFLFAASSGVGYILTDTLGGVKNPVYVWIYPGILRHAPRFPANIIPGYYPPLALRGLPRSKEYSIPVEFTRTGAFKLRPMGIQPNGLFVVGLKTFEQVAPVGRLGREVFLSPLHIPVLHMLLRLADVSAYLTRHIFGEHMIGEHKEYSALARLDYALTMFHTLLIADFPAYRAAIDWVYAQSDIPQRAPFPGHRLVVKVTGTPDQLALIYNSLPFYVGVTLFPEVKDLVRIKKPYKRFL